MTRAPEIAIEPLVFVDGRWRAAEPALAAAPRRLRLITWNVWFGGHMFDERAAALLAELERRRPDVALLQEVTPELLAHVTRAPWVRADYALSDADGRTLRRYGVAILSRAPVRRMTLLPLPSRMGRALLTAELATGLPVATVHLESTDVCAVERAAQLGIIQPHLRGLGEDALLAGDMNFAPDAELENAAHDPSFVDVWPALRGDAPGYTIDTDVNLMRSALKRDRDQRRIDRVFLRGGRWRPGAIEVIGARPIDEVGTFVSDHLGLEVTLEPA